MTPEEIKAIMILCSRAPLRNMEEAAAAQKLLAKLQAHFVPTKQKTDRKRKR